MAYYKFNEYNTWECEAWHFYLELTSEQHTQLKELIRDTSYSLGDEEIPLASVQTLVNGSPSGYMPEHNFGGPLTGELPSTYSAEDDPFYKGGILDFFSGVMPA
jgi:hypothetical protein